ncbi:hypothetical protein XNC1_1554 [Xenorhabdus nematophila ATCC 19061]|uniref:Uncharacterized protein n=1 Tax=Xenorhabdus nematophila (strain ATCC 19061 / DSM 3370 / CCUG 14189 / LMG 1036 / NCIMB 9965 / AN6) TaxID=406817 RepID=D3VBH8_XENNA|nr:hypothetical protein XNC1_1554 [Xenorhabdus nematophila ATCC 19061]CEK22505.1 hypothetical protein XNC2_1511 [Xenorhabdus nematophila AN6/1]
MNKQSINKEIENTSNDPTNDNHIFVPNGQILKISTTIGNAWDLISPKLGMWVVPGLPSH